MSDAHESPGQRPPEPPLFEFSGEIFSWRGPAPYVYVAVPGPLCDDIHEIAADVTYGWGMIPVRATVGQTVWRTSLFPKDGGYLLPLKNAVRDAEGLDVDEQISVQLEVGG